TVVGSSETGIIRRKGITAAEASGIRNFPLIGLIISDEAIAHLPAQLPLAPVVTSFQRSFKQTFLDQIKGIITDLPRTAVIHAAAFQILIFKYAVIQNFQGQGSAVLLEARVKKPAQL